jgi:hypothetical protein
LTQHCFFFPGEFFDLSEDLVFNGTAVFVFSRDKNLHININTYFGLQRVGGGRGRSRCRGSEQRRTAQTRQLSFAYKAEQWLTGVTALTLDGGDRNGLLSFSEREGEFPEGVRMVGRREREG